MKSPVILRLLLSLLVFLASGHSISAQFTFDNPANVNASTMAQTLAGQGVTISNATLNCANNAYAQFTSAPAGLGITDGILLTSGSAMDVNQNNDIFFNPQASVDNGLFGDASLDASLALNSPTLISTDACVLTFDITVFGDTLKFDYRFGSEEYDNYVCSGFNDVFGFYVSGANPAGGNYVEQNVALIPGTNTPVSINTVNDGVSDDLFSTVPCQLNNTAFYSGVIPGVVYSGNTELLQAVVPTVACSTYTMKLAIGDGSESFFLDRIFDSGVFLKAGSFSSNQVVIAASSVISDVVDFAVEGCVSGQFIFERTGDIGLAYSLPIDIQGSATNGIDYTTINDTIFFAPGQQFDTVTITPISDGIQEGFETVTLYSLSQCNGIPFDSASLTLFDSLPVTVTPEDTIVCAGESVILQGTAGPFTYDWSPSGILNSTNTLTVVANPTLSGTDVQLVQTFGGCIDTAVSRIGVSDPSWGLVITQPDCASGTNTGSLVGSFAGLLGPPNIFWSHGPTVIDQPSLSPGTYTLTLTDSIDPNIACTIDTTFDIVDAGSLSYNITIDTIDCGATDGLGTISGLLPNSNYIIGYSQNGILIQAPTGILSDASGVIVLSSLTSGSLIVTIEDPSTGCLDTTSTNVEQNVNFTLTLSSTAPTCLDDDNGEANVFVNGGVQPFTFLWDDPTGQTTDTALNLTAGTYTVQVSDGQGCFDNGSIIIPEGDSVSVTLSGRDITCNGASDGQAVANVNGGTSPYLYQWSNGEDSSTIIALGPGTISVVVTDAQGCDGTASTLLNEPNAIIYQASIVEPNCNNPLSGSISLSIQGGSMPYNVVWSDGISGPSRSNLGQGLYGAVIADNNGCQTPFSTFLDGATGPEITSIDVDSSGCIGSSSGQIQILGVTGGIPPYQYSIDSGLTYQSSAVFSNLPSGTYGLSVEDADGCRSMPFGSIVSSTPSVILEVIPSDTTITLLDTLALELVIQFPDIYEDSLLTNIVWSPAEDLDCSDCLSPMLIPEQTYYSFEVSASYPNNPCIIPALATTSVENNLNVFIPNAFSPNGDGVNDFFKVYGEHIVSHELIITDRWGEIIFVGNQQEPGWDGTWKGKVLPPNTFGYLFKGRFADGQEIDLKGSFLLIR